MKRWKISLYTALLAVAGVLVSAGPALAAPGNDDIADATAFSSLPYDDGPYSTVGATTAAEDQDCAGIGNSSVWYVFTPGSGGTVYANTLGSDYDTTLGVYTGSPGALAQIACNDQFGGNQSAVLFDVDAGQMYYIEVAAWEVSPPGTLVFHAESSTGLVSTMFRWHNAVVHEDGHENHCNHDPGDLTVFINGTQHTTLLVGGGVRDLIRWEGTFTIDPIGAATEPILYTGHFSFGGVVHLVGRTAQVTFMENAQYIDQTGNKVHFLGLFRLRVNANGDVILDSFVAHFPDEECSP